MRKLIYIIILSFLAPIIGAKEKGNIQIFCQPNVKFYLDDEYKGKSNKKNKGFIFENVEYGVYKVRLKRNRKSENITVNLNDSIHNYISVVFNSEKEKETLYNTLYLSETELDMSATEDYYPAHDEFVEIDIFPEMLYQGKPEYPKNEKEKGIVGTVWVKCLVDKNGKVVKSIVGKTSKNEALDQSAIKASYKNKFNPAIQNGKPVAVWITYKVNFQLDN